MAGAYGQSWLLPLVDQDRQARREIRQLERVIDEFLDLRGNRRINSVLYIASVTQ